jgi:predicted Fe-Mo cluster-binding NifX family protein
MKIAIPAVENKETANIESRFGRTPWFMVFDTETKKWESIENSTNLQAVQGAGIQSAETLVRNGINAVLTPHCGPKAFRVLLAGGVSVYIGATGTVENAMKEYEAGNLKLSESADVDGHWQ